MAYRLLAKMFNCEYVMWFETEEEAEAFKAENEGIIDFC